MGRSIKRFDRGALIRLATWGMGAAIALMLAVLTSLSDAGSQRMGAALTTLTANGAPAPVTVARLAQRTADVEAERRRLNEAIRLLAADRDRLQTRVVSIERNLDDITGSIKRQAEQTPLSRMPGAASEATGSLADIPWVDPQETAAAAEKTGAIASPVQHLPQWMANWPDSWPSHALGSDATTAADAPSRGDPASVPTAAATTSPPAPPRSRAAITTPPEMPLAATTTTIAPPEPPPAASATRPEFGVDIGGGANLDELRVLWSAVKARHPKLLGGLRPIFSVREDKYGAVDLRLIVGPLANAGAAAKLCASLGAADVMCSTRTYEGERLAVR